MIHFQRSSLITTNSSLKGDLVWATGNVVIDTNVLLVSLPSHSPFHPIYQALLANRFIAFVTNEILTEYEEQISIRLGVTRTEVQIRELLNLPGLRQIDIYYRWQLIILHDPTPYWLNPINRPASLLPANIQLPATHSTCQRRFPMPRPEYRANADRVGSGFWSGPGTTPSHPDWPATLR